MSRHTLDEAHKAWGEAIPDWIVALADECDRGGQGATARRIGVSKTTINEVVRRRYKARLGNVEQKVRGALMGTTVVCPVLGEIGVDLCLENQKRPFSAANPVRVQLHRSCPTCPHKRTRPSPSSSPHPKPDTSSPRE